MLITLNTEKELMNYMNFLHHTSSLLTQLGPLTIEEDKVIEFLDFVDAIDEEDFSHIYESAYCVENKESIPPNHDFPVLNNARTHWCTNDIEELGTLILEETNPKAIAKHFGRSEESIRKQSRAIYEVSYNGFSWVPSTNKEKVH